MTGGSSEPSEPSDPARDDPGWPPLRPRAVLAAMIPGMLHRQTVDDTVPAIVPLRRVFLGFVVAPLVFLVVLASVVPVATTDLRDPRGWGLVALGVLTSLSGASAARRRRIVCAGPASIARQASAVMFFGLATAQSAALLGFAAAFLVDALWPYLVALVPTAVGLVRSAPSGGQVARLDHQLRAAGCALSASQVLFAHPGDAASPVDDR